MRQQESKEAATAAPAPEETEQTPAEQDTPKEATDQTPHQTELRLN